MNIDEKWNSASIRIFSKVIRPENISEILKTNASRSYPIGEPLSKRNPNGPKRKEHLWILESDLESSLSLEYHIERLVEFMETRMNQLHELLINCQIDLYCGFSSGSGQGGFVLTASLLERIARIPTNIVFNLFPPESC